MSAAYEPLWYSTLRIAPRNKGRNVQTIPLQLVIVFPPLRCAALRNAVLIWGYLLFPTLLVAQAPQAPMPEMRTAPLEQPPAAGADLLKLERWLQRDLVGTTPQGRLRLAAGPRVTDLTGSKLIESTFGLKYGFIPQWMGAVRLRFYSENPFTTNDRSDWGLGDLLVESKYHLASQLPFHLDVAVGLKVLIPLTAAENRSDGVVHVMPFFTLLQPTTRWASLAWYMQLGSDIVTDNIHRDPLAKEIQESFLIGAAGLVYHSTSALLFFFDVEWDTTFLLGAGDRHNVFVTPGVRYKLPTPSWLPGLWHVEAGVHIGLADTLNRYDLGFRGSL